MAHYLKALKFYFFAGSNAGFLAGYVYLLIYIVDAVKVWKKNALTHSVPYDNAIAFYVKLIRR